MSANLYTRHSAVQDFHQARQRAALEQIVARLTGKPVELLSYDEVYHKLRPTGRSDIGVKEIPLDAIVGSVGRYHDFTRTFLPRQARAEHRWANIQAVVSESSIDALPPIEVYQIGEAYFVRDGHHRVSVARQQGFSHIRAYVTKVRTRVPLSPDVQPDDLILKAEYAAFLENTRLDQLRPEADLSASVPGEYTRLENHIEVHRHFMGLEAQREIPYEEAVGHWYDEVYLPVVQAIRAQGILRYFPGRTETDLYLWISEHCAALREELGWQIKPAAAITKLAAQVRPRPRRLVARLGQRLLDAVIPDRLRSGPAPGQWREQKAIDRYSDRLFADVLVPLSGEAAGWHALEQALVVARREGAQLNGLHVVASDTHKHSAEAQAIRDEFDRRCREAGAAGSLAVEVGETARRVCERAVLNDLVVLNLAHPPAAELIPRLGSGFRQIIQHCPRPIWVVPRTASPLDRALLAYDDSAKAREALFVATYLAETWKIPLVVLSVPDAGRSAEDMQAHARKYLDMHEIAATFVETNGHVPEAILQIAEQHDSDLIIMGGYGHKPMLDVVLGSSVDQVLRESHSPMLICR